MPGGLKYDAHRIPQAESTRRSSYLDNVKGILIFLVVLGHLIESEISEDPFIKTLYLSIYSFHMPAFAIVSGMLSRGEFTTQAVLKSAKSLLPAFVAFSALYELFHYLMTGEASRYLRNFQPYWMLWFLYSLFLWRLFLPVILRIPHPISISFLVAVGAGYFESIGYFLGLSRTLYFFPFFLVGHGIATGSLIQLRFRFDVIWVRCLFFAIVGLNILSFWHFSDMDHRWLYGSLSYAELGVQGIGGGAIRLLLIMVSLITALSVMMLVPVNQGEMSRTGRHSLQIYVWHGFFIKLLVGAGIASIIGEYHASIAIPLFAAVSMLLTLLLSRDFIVIMTRKWVIGPVQRLVFERKR